MHCNIYISDEFFSNVNYNWFHGASGKECAELKEIFLVIFSQCCKILG